MKLSTRLVLLILGCLLPILTAQVYSQVNLYAERHDQLSGLVLRQAELANANMISIVDGVRQFGMVAGQFPFGARIRWGLRSTLDRVAADPAAVSFPCRILTFGRIVVLRLGRGATGNWRTPIRRGWPTF